MARILPIAALLVGLFGATAAQAETICTIDFQKAAAETNEGKALMSKIDSSYKSRQDELQRMQKEFEAAVADYQKRAMLLSAEAKAEEEQKLGMRQQQLQQTAMQYEGELQQMNMTMLQDLDAKMRVVAGDVGKSKGCTVVIDSAVVVYAAAGVTDITTELVTKYNSSN
jgi:outer membrane protein